MDTPLPISANSGPGQAPVSAPPRPKIVPPAPYRIPLPGGLTVSEILSPDTDFSPARLMTAMEIAAVAIAEQIIPYMRKD